MVIIPSITILLDLLLILDACQKNVNHYNQKGRRVSNYLDYHEEVDNVFDLENRVFHLEIVLEMRNARLDEEVNVAEGAKLNQR